jgi:hypothetical protein
MKKILETLAEVERALEDVNDWRRDHDEELEAKQATAYIGNGAGWRFLLVRWPVGPDTWAYDGTATQTETATIIHLTKELAAKAAHLAEGKTYP